MKSSQLIQRATLASQILLLVVSAVSENHEADYQSVPYSDEHTVALWLFDEPNYLMMTLTDAGRNYWDLRLNVDVASLAPGKFGNALTLGRETGVATIWANGSEARHSRLVPFEHSPRELIRALSGSDWTWEFWLRLDRIPEQHITIFELGPKKSGPHTSCTLMGSGRRFVIRGEIPEIEFHCPTKYKVLTDEEWHHIAFTYNRKRKQIAHFFDGELQPAAIPRERRGNGNTSLEPGLIGVRYANIYLAQPARVNVQPRIELDAVEESEAFSHRWIGFLKTSITGSLTLSAEADDGLYILLRNRPLIEIAHGQGTTSASIVVNADELYPIELRYYHTREGKADARLLWSWPGHGPEQIPPEAFWHKADRRVAMENVTAVDKAAQEEGYVFSIGRNLNGGQPLEGQIDEMRISDVIRYTENFQPESFSRNFGSTSPKPAVITGPAHLFGSKSEPGPIWLGRRKHLFIDAKLIESHDNVKLTLNPPLRIEPVQLPEQKPWDAADPSPLCVYEHDGTIHINYHNDGLWKTQENLICLWTSRDGLQFESPILGRVEWRGSTKNNIILKYPGQGTFFKDLNPATPPEERFKFTCFGMERGVHVFVSPDGIVWQRNETLGVFSDIGGGVETFWDNQWGEYLIYLRHEGFARGNRGATGRAAALTTTNELLKPWPFDPILNPEPNKITEELPIPFHPADSGEVYRTRAAKYPWAPDTYLAFPWRMIGDHVLMQSELATSRDGVYWKFFGDEPYYFSVSESKSVVSSATQALIIYGLIRRNDEVWQYARVDAKDSTLVRLTQRLDRFVSLDAGEKTGMVITHNLIFSGDRLELSLKAQGQVRVALLNPNGSEIPGFGLGDCDPIRADSTGYQVSWNGHSDISSTAGYMIKLHFELQQAKLFALEFKDSNADSQ